MTKAIIFTVGYHTPNRDYSHKYSYIPVYDGESLPDALQRFTRYPLHDDPISAYIEARQGYNVVDFSFSTLDDLYELRAHAAEYFRDRPASAWSTTNEDIGDYNESCSYQV